MGGRGARVVGGGRGVVSWPAAAVCVKGGFALCLLASQSGSFEREVRRFCENVSCGPWRNLRPTASAYGMPPSGEWTLPDLAEKLKFRTDAPENAGGETLQKGLMTQNQGGKIGPFSRRI